MRFIKYHGLGNDFVLLRCGGGGGGGGGAEVALEPALAVALCARGAGVGADGVVAARPSAVAALRMEILNADGSRPEMCGNGIRCLVKYAVKERGLVANPLPIETPAGVRHCHWTADPGGRVASVRVDMGRPSFRREDIPMAADPAAGAEALELELLVDGRRLRATGGSVGNPHMVLLGDAGLGGPGEEGRGLLQTARTWGPRLAAHPLWLAGANVGFVEQLERDHLRLVVWERGCGLTRACGTGATAAVAAAARLGRVPFDEPVRVELPGGELCITAEAGPTGTAWMEGPVAEVYRGEVSAAWLALSRSSD